MLPCFPKILALTDMTSVGMESLNCSNIKQVTFSMKEEQKW